MQNVRSEILKVQGLCSTLRVYGPEPAGELCMRELLNKGCYTFTSLQQRKWGLLESSDVRPCVACEKKKPVQNVGIVLIFLFRWIHESEWNNKWCSKLQVKLLLIIMCWILWKKEQTTIVSLVISQLSLLFWNSTFSNLHIFTSLKSTNLYFSASVGQVETP